MSKEAYFSGEPIQLNDMLRAREERALRQLHLLKEYPEGSLLSVTMNIPGPIKTSPKLLEAFDIVIKAIQTALADDKICYQLRLLPTTGYEYYLITSLPSRDLKLKMIALETDLPIGRLMDLDVLVLSNGRPSPISRTTLGAPPRRCFICSKEAKVCGRLRQHSIEDMQAAITNLLHSFFNQDNPSLPLDKIG
ncbi:citrate lyase holo-[acyl-carrier protein] synthase [Streptococcus dysgalactiae]|nr:citrate lyase holo-[acyl-carrier protein] synthase [Streptococcus dysgalactiae]CRH93307.1 2'-(5''-triphosphoribosyl)-3'-dephospho-CoA:apo-citrate lyase [Chlamydia trachomatis]KKC16548.1 ACP synthase [Streptococcus dysgalactiae subsp. equisimilis]KKC22042.1 ACP synthase [Streptococcus dysgalactiae subsp. equisimilis]MBM6541589.1 citrate lyase holo-[acyl-carrier protein] synthase [Streptococcus dysgalactiae subsp. equisimilis]OBZ05673.1 citrate lyase holo-ACP synthase [Streptococcus dysgalact